MCFGFSQMTITWPFLLMILHLSQIFFTEGFTFKTYTTFQKYGGDDYLLRQVILPLVGS